MPNHYRNWLRLDESDLAGGGSEHLVDGLLAWGEDGACAARIRAHLDADADHVIVQVAQPDGPVGSEQTIKRVAAIAASL